MKTIGLIGGVSWISTLDYYRYINEGVNKHLGGHSSAKMLIYSVNFDEVEGLMIDGRWDELNHLIYAEAKRLQAAGADFVAIASNTINKTVEFIEPKLSVPMLHIADATAEAIREQGLKTVGLLGTRFTMEEDFIKGRLRDKFGLEVIVPSPEDRKEVSRVIFEELVNNDLRDESRSNYLKIIDRLVKEGAEGVILGCTEIPLLIKEASVPLFDTTALHCEYIVKAALDE